MYNVVSIVCFPERMCHVQKRLNAPMRKTVILGDSMDTDVIAGIESQTDTVLVFSGVTNEETMKQYPYRPYYVLSGVGEIARYAAGR